MTFIYKFHTDIFSKLKGIKLTYALSCNLMDEGGNFNNCAKIMDAHYTTVIYTAGSTQVNINNKDITE